ncbi:putative membrane protein [Amycolatopsis xylanica]|uniref:Putative membrane protein n=1 Tax=Amycolatopsis xylanica TaxID=589385 RepID=A0A1H3PQ00_9PSEU|nr:PH domain-containing protein [Amycolatopsis xylanica]SDZ03108.1 putative membrane protein [Amycolatopsis xylanica]
MTSPWAPPEASAETETDWRKLSPKMLLVHPLNEVVRALPGLLAILVVGASTGRGPWWTLFGVGVLVVLGVLRWFTTTYRVTPRQVQIRKGLLRKQVLTVSTDRVRTVDIDAQALHRVLGLAAVTVGTGRSDKGNEGIKLDALTADEAQRLRDELLHRSPVTAETDVADLKPPETTLAELDPKWIRFGPFTLSGLVTVGVLGAALSRVLSEAEGDLDRFGPLRVLFRHLENAPLAQDIAEIVGVLAVVVIVASTAGYVLAYWNFRLSRHQSGTLHISRGLINKRSTTIEERRLRGVEVSEPLLLRLVRGAKLLAITTGLRVGRGTERGGTVLLPPAPREEAVRVAAIVGAPEPLSADLVEHGPQARRRRYTRAFAGAAVLIGLAFLLWAIDLVTIGVALSSLIVVPIAAALAFDRYRNLGHAVVGSALVSGHGSLVRRRVVLTREGIVGWNVRRSFFQRRAGLATLTATTAAGHQHYSVPDVETSEALHVAGELLPLVGQFLVPSAEKTQ